MPEKTVRVVNGKILASVLPVEAETLILQPSNIIYNTNGLVTSITENGVTTIYTYNADGTVNTETRLGKRRTWTYDASGNPSSSTVVNV